MSQKTPENESMSSISLHQDEDAQRIIDKRQILSEDLSPVNEIETTSEDNLKSFFSCPPHGTVAKCLTVVLVFALLWGSLVTILGRTALPGGNIFSLFILFICAIGGGHLISFIKLPPLLGMLIVGIMLRSVPYINTIGNNIDQEWSSALRNIALVVILIRAGLGLDPAALKQLSFMVVRLAFSPCLVETLATAVLTHILLGFPWLWGLMLGFVLSAVTPAVIVPCMLSLSEQGYGVHKGIPTLVIAAASIDDVLAISGFTVLLGITFSSGSLVMQILQGPLDVLIGLSYGVSVGFICWVLPHNDGGPLVPPLRFCLLLFGGLFALFGSAHIEFGGAGALGVLVMSFIGGIGWRKQGWTDDTNPVARYFNYSWLCLEPFLFALIGSEIEVLALDGDTVAWGLITLLIGSLLRMITSFLVVMGGNLTFKERVFVSLAWLPKATVQAAIGSTALDMTYKLAKDTEYFEAYEKLGKQVLTIAVLVILITAPVGAAAIMLTAPMLLSKQQHSPKLDSIQSL